MIKRKQGLTLVELTIGIIISALLLCGIMHLLSAGMKGSTKGLAHQANMEAASILMSQIEYDLLRATNIKDPANNEKDKSARWEMYNSHSKDGAATVLYTVGPDGVTRNVELKDGSKKENTVFCAGHSVELAFTRFAVETGFEQIRHGMFVELKVSAKDKKTAALESFEMKRLIMVRSQF